MREQRSFLRGPARFVAVVTLGLCSLACVGCGGSSTTSSEKSTTSTNAADDVKSLLEKATMLTLIERSIAK